MIQKFSSIFSDFVDNHQDAIDAVQEFVKERAVLDPIPLAITIISSMSAGYLFNCASLSAGAIFGAVNYITLTSIVELIRMNHDINNPMALAFTSLSAAISQAFLQTVCKTSLTYQGIFILGAASFAGQFIRETFFKPET